MLALALQVFEQYDADRSGQLSRRELKKVLQDARLGLSARQVRLVLSRLDTSNDGQLSFAEFAPLMADILAEQLRQELRAGQWGGLESRLRELIAEADGDGTGLLFRAQLVDVLLAQELVSISRMQANAMVAAAPEEADGSIRIDRFVPIAVAMLRALSSPEAVAERCAMLERADFTPIELMGGREREAMEATFAEAFAKYDVDNNRFLVRAGRAGRGRTRLPPPAARCVVCSPRAPHRARACTRTSTNSSCASTLRRSVSSGTRFTRCSAWPTATATGRSTRRSLSAVPTATCCRSSASRKYRPRSARGEASCPATTSICSNRRLQMSQSALRQSSQLLALLSQTIQSGRL